MATAPPPQETEPVHVAMLYMSDSVMSIASPSPYEYPLIDTDEHGGPEERLLVCWKTTYRFGAETKALSSCDHQVQLDPGSWYASAPDWAASNAAVPTPTALTTLEGFTFVS